MSDAWMCPICLDGDDGRKKQFHACGLHEFHEECLKQQFAQYDAEIIRHISKMVHDHASPNHFFVEPFLTYARKCSVCRYDPGPIPHTHVVRSSPIPCKHCGKDITFGMPYYNWVDSNCCHVACINILKQSPRSILIILAGIITLK
jgi:hypothetical protein